MNLSFLPPSSLSPPPLPIFLCYSLYPYPPRRPLPPSLIITVSGPPWTCPSDSSRSESSSCLHLWYFSSRDSAYNLRHHHNFLLIYLQNGKFERDSGYSHICWSDRFPIRIITLRRKRRRRKRKTWKFFCQRKNEEKIRTLIKLISSSNYIYNSTTDITCKVGGGT